MRIAVDFDGTIVNHRYPAIGSEIPFAISTLRKLEEDGHQIILWTVREGKLLDEAVEFCRKRGLEFYSVNAEYPNADWSGSGVSRKISADLYIDDLNLGGIPSWGDIYTMIVNGEAVKLAGDGRKPRHRHRHRGLFARLRHRTRAARSKLIPR